MLELKTSLSENILDIELRGSLDSQSASDFKAWVLEKNVQGYNIFAINCQDLEFISSRGIGALLEIKKLLDSRQSHIALYHLSLEVLNLLKFLNLTRELTIRESLHEIITAYAAGATIPEAGEPRTQEAPGGDQKSVEEEEVEESLLWSEVQAEEKEEVDETEEIIDLGSLDDGFTPESMREAKTGTKHPETESPSKPSISKEETNATESEPLTTETKKPDVLGNEEYIDLSQSESLSGSFTDEETIIDCPNCSEPLRVNRNGQYLCPECRTKFRYPIE